jgi:hypothetical protein
MNGHSLMPSPVPTAIHQLRVPQHATQLSVICAGRGLHAVATWLARSLSRQPMIATLTLRHANACAGAQAWADRIADGLRMLARLSYTRDLPLGLIGLGAASEGVLRCGSRAPAAVGALICANGTSSQLGDHELACIDLPTLLLTDLQPANLLATRHLQHALRCELASLSFQCLLESPSGRASLLAHCHAWLARHLRRECMVRRKVHGASTRFD